MAFHLTLTADQPERDDRDDDTHPGRVVNRFHRWYCSTGHWRQVVQDGIVPWVLRGVELGSRTLELGPGPGLSTDVVSRMVEHLVAVEVDPRLAESLRTRVAGSNVEVTTGDGAKLPFDDSSFSSVVCFTMLHHVPSVAQQDRLLTEVYRVLSPGGVFAGSDSTSSLVFRAAHLFDTLVLVDPRQFGSRLEHAGFDRVSVRHERRVFKFMARRP